MWSAIEVTNRNKYGGIASLTLTLVLDLDQNAAEGSERTTEEHSGLLLK